ncbi:sensor domain-containing diguanylate cyclase [Methylobacterium sp. J-076]|uniref:sensor domain-containing diguanylate cyclase n=1 Tax=Methylobacterium sp. J-076 TaxID=2836655 RepID=UPI001FBBB92C|nr:sensor domain-containing diguanylate cyclase [Methylobacterium sp. J-076]MCJ2012238.1 sensor domain-containing diguanylate cyclase [Methylobacterium sp. J-076]
MVLPLSLARRLRSARTWIALGVLAPIGMLAVSGTMLLDMRQDAYAKAEQTSQNLLQVLERDIDRNIELFDLSLRAVAKNLRAPGVAEVPASLRQLILFDRAATAQDMGVMFVLDERGDIAVDEGAVPPRQGNYADREYFRIHKTRTDIGLYIGQPIVSRLTGERMLPFSRRIDRPDGSFGGVAFGSLKLSYFSHLFEPVGLGRDGAINLDLRNGTRIMRHPYVEADIGMNVAGRSTFQRFVSARSGTMVGTSPRDGIERHYAFTQIGAWPLVLNVALSTREIEAEWRTKAFGIGGIVLVLCGLTMFLSLLYGRDLRRREAMQAELARLSSTDALTGLPNRRRFEQEFERAWEGARLAGKPLSLLIVDVDHFKRVNDRYGHPVGDAVLRELARCLSASVSRPRDLVCRIGGEEFVVLLPDTDQPGAVRVAGEIHDGVRTLGIAAAGIRPGAVTVSIGLAAGPLTAGTKPDDLYRNADAALYEAKTGGRNQTQCAAEGATRDRVLRLVGV